MELPVYQIDAFTDKIFCGNPACVVPLKEWLPNDLLLEIAKENAVAETAFFIITAEGVQLRWFTPEYEIDLCGHATLATAHALKTILDYPEEEIIFHTQSGELKVKTNNGKYSLNFPSRRPVAVEIPDLLKKSLDLQPMEILKARDFVLVYPSEEDIKNIEINRFFFDQLELGTGGVIFTSKGRDCDFVSRFFTPGASVFEDPVTGSAHCSLIPYWSRKLEKTELIAKQISPRGGELFCEDMGEHVLISGKARTYLKGSFFID
ncbi:PhzF family phenazine biosynthesis protein [Zunongwangia sp. F363]|uniref:PhzF family phenazine biosynthesis protein n=1 Tax=Autumnicola tepida TaxID=3075595 RepID=A0ABU3CBS0_9FLAO|nr:PhzF family phenazine biosynthesis protein [Zunongwangia sp. F363]MDT0643779.1 PhzF family phenazine biosynthesis protein [Zunongwangia sp. F363]